MRRVWFSLVVLGCFWPWVGCGPSGPTYHRVSGTTTFHGNPIPLGTIYFDADVTEGGSGLQGFADIRDGKFDTAQGGQGVLGGPYTVRVQGYDGKAGPESPYGQPLFPEYEIKRELPAAESELNLDVPM